VSRESELEGARRLVGAALAALETSRDRLDDLDVYPVPDGDTGTNLTLTLQAVAAAAASAGPARRPELVSELARAALLGARGTSGVILSQMARGAAEVVASSSGRIGPRLLARALRSASGAADRAVRRPVEGTMLSVARALAEEAEGRAGEDDQSLGDLLARLVRCGEEALARTPEQLAVLREAGVVDAGGAGLVELLRGLADELAERRPPPLAAGATRLAAVDAEAESSSYRYCTVFVVEGPGLCRARLEARLEPVGDVLLVAGDERALEVHIHTADPGAALSAATAVGRVGAVEITGVHEGRVSGRRPGSATAGAPFPSQRAGHLSLVPRPTV
jgi:dihydroxyacetone kinase-like predicted kinase